MWKYAAATIADGVSGKMFTQLKQNNNEHYEKKYYSPVKRKCKKRFVVTSKDKTKHNTNDIKNK